MFTKEMFVSKDGFSCILNFEQAIKLSQKTGSVVCFSNLDKNLSFYANKDFRVPFNLPTGWSEEHLQFPVLPDDKEYAGIIEEYSKLAKTGFRQLSTVEEVVDLLNFEKQWLERHEAYSGYADESDASYFARIDTILESKM